MTDRLTKNDLNQRAGDRARRDFTALKDSWTVGEAIESLRTREVGEAIVYFYVTDDGGKLVGIVPTRRLLMTRPDEKLAGIMVRRVVSIPASMSLLDACEFFVMYRLLAFPVVDEADRLVGVVDVNLFTDEVFNLSEAQAAQDIFQLIGVHVARARRPSPWAGFKNRFPWLLCNIAGGVACAVLAGFYEGLLDAVIVLALFIPVVLALAESVSIQSMTITLAGFHQTRVEWRSLARSLAAEAVTAVLLGCGCGTLVGTVAWLWKGRIAVAVSIGASIWLAIVTACLLGVLLPTLIRAVKGNPRIAAGPMVLALADLATLMFYFNLCGWMLG